MECCDGYAESCPCWYEWEEDAVVFEGEWYVFKEGEEVFGAFFKVVVDVVPGGVAYCSAEYFYGWYACCKANCYSCGSCDVL